MTDAIDLDHKNLLGSTVLPAAGSDRIDYLRQIVKEIVPARIAVAPYWTHTARELLASLLAIFLSQRAADQVDRYIGYDFHGADANLEQFKAWFDMRLALAAAGPDGDSDGFFRTMAMIAQDEVGDVEIVQVLHRISTSTKGQRQFAVNTMVDALSLHLYLAGRDTHDDDSDDLLDEEARAEPDDERHRDHIALSPIRDAADRRERRWAAIGVVAICALALALLAIYLLKNSPTTPPGPPRIGVPAGNPLLKAPEPVTPQAMNVQSGVDALDFEMPLSLRPSGMPSPFDTPRQALPRPLSPFSTSVPLPTPPTHKIALPEDLDESISLVDYSVDLGDSRPLAVEIPANARLRVSAPADRPRCLEVTYAITNATKKPPTFRLCRNDTYPNRQ